MEANNINDCMKGCLGLTGLDASTAAQLLGRCQAQVFDEGSVIYAEGTGLDNTFGLLISGHLVVEQGGSEVAVLLDQQVFGEMAYFNPTKSRTATIRVGSPNAIIAQFKLTPQELDSTRLARLRKRLSLQSWEKFVSSSQSAA